MARAPASPCALCPEPSSDSHHIYPVCYGGASDGPQVRLCKNHHTGQGGVHWWADEVWAHRATLDAIAAQTRVRTADLRRLAECILKQRAVFVETGAAPDARRRIVAELSAEEQQLARLVKVHRGYHSLEAMIVGLITREAAAIKRGE